MEILQGFACLLLCQTVGELLARGLGLALPGPVVGMLLLLLALNITQIRAVVAVAAQALLSNLSLLFVPVGVGVMAHLGLVHQHGWRLLVVIVVSTVLGLAVTAWVLQKLWRTLD